MVNISVSDMLKIGGGIMLFTNVQVGLPLLLLAGSEILDKIGDKTMMMSIPMERRIAPSLRHTPAMGTFHPESARDEACLHAPGGRAPSLRSRAL